MIHENTLISHITGNGYGEEIIISYVTEKSTILFKQLSYMLIDSFDGELEMNLNFGSKKFLPHALKRIGEHFMLIPRFYAVNSGRYPNQQMFFDIEQYWTHDASQLFIFPKNDLFQLWQALNYDPAELNPIGDASQSDLILLWLILSKYQTHKEVLLSFKKYAEIISMSVIAEESPNNISIKYILSKIISMDFQLYKPTWDAMKDTQFHTVYLLNEDKSVCEWKALAIVNSNLHLVLDGLFVKIAIIDDPTP